MLGGGAKSSSHGSSLEEAARCHGRQARIGRVDLVRLLLVSDADPEELSSCARCAAELVDPVAWYPASGGLGLRTVKRLK